jgi:hypothetical protein
LPHEWPEPFTRREWVRIAVGIALILMVIVGSWVLFVLYVRAVWDVLSGGLP